MRSEKYGFITIMPSEGIIKAVSRYTIGLHREDLLRFIAQFDTLRIGLIKVAARVTEMVTRIKVSLPSSFESLTELTARTIKLPP